ncbi:MAG TPA: flagellar basal body L-ring protein FlgH [Gammaproteobacteria bacterium]|nr:flagellar basal body L-ring protein FlgH [Gammaproteobacteria bacterium]
MARAIIASVLLGLALSLPAAAESLFHEETFLSYAADRRAARIGDALTVLIVETSSAEARADTAADHSTGLNAVIREPAGRDEYGLSVGRTTDGGGHVRRSGKIQAAMTVSIVAITPTNDYIVSGTQLLLVNDEEQRISVYGRVRPNDISSENTVLSTRLADARIEYVGEGVLAGSQRPGLVYRFLNWLGLL